MNNKILVTGATGFLGSHLVRRLVREGIKVRAVIKSMDSKFTYPVEEWGVDTSGLLEKIKWDIGKQEPPMDLLDGVDAVIHLAALYRKAGVSDKDYHDTHVFGTQKLLEVSYKAGIGRFIHISTVGVHGHIESPPADENYPMNPGDIYQMTKAQGEKMSWHYFMEKKLPLTVIRPAAIYGHYDMRLYKLFNMVRKGRFILIGDGAVHYHMVFVEDLVNAILLALETERAVGEAFIVGGGECFTIKEIALKIGEILGIEFRFLRIPYIPVYTLGALFEKIFIPFGIEPPLYRRRVDFYIKNRCFNIEKAGRILGYSPAVSLEQGLRITAQWYREKGML